MIRSGTARLLSHPHANVKEAINQSQRIHVVHWLKICPIAAPKPVERRGGSEEAAVSSTR